MLIRKISKTNILIKFQNKIKNLYPVLSPKGPAVYQPALPWPWNLCHCLNVFEIFFKNCVRCSIHVAVWLLSCVWLFVTPWTVCSPPGSSVHRVSQARILEWVAISFSRGSSLPKDQTCISCIGRWILYHWGTRKACIIYGDLNLQKWPFCLYNCCRNILQKLLP